MEEVVVSYGSGGVNGLSSVEWVLVGVFLAVAVLGTLGTVWFLRERLRPHCLRPRAGTQRRQRQVAAVAGHQRRQGQQQQQPRNSTPTTFSDSSFLRWLLRKRYEVPADMLLPSDSDDTFRTASTTLDVTGEELDAVWPPLAPRQVSFEDERNPDARILYLPFRSTQLVNTNYSF
jgi:hypothetical protein